jgi:hypothetical protein
MKTVAYLKTTLDRQEVQEQKLAILEFAHTEGMTVSRLMEMPAPPPSEKGLTNSLPRWKREILLL